MKMIIILKMIIKYKKMIMKINIINNYIYNYF